MSIAVKLIIASSVMIASCVVLISWVSVQKISEQAREQIRKHEEQGIHAFRRESVLVASATAQTFAYLAINNAWQELTDALPNALKEHNEIEPLPPDGKRSAKPEILWFLAFDEDADLLTGMNAEGTEAGVWRTPGAPVDRAALDQVIAELGPPAQPGKELPKARCSPAAPSAQSATWMCEAPIAYNKTVTGTLWMRVSAAALTREVNKVKLGYLERERAYRRNVLLVAGGILFIGILLAALQGLSLARPIAALTEQATRIAGGDLESRVVTGRRDELGVLAVTFNFMSDRIGVLMKEQEEKARLEHEMNLARSVQQSMLPPSALTRYEGINVLGYCSPASSCGGDWWMYRKLSGGRMLIVVGDATGHGIHSAMIAATARGAVEALAALDERLLVPEQVLRAIDSAIRNVGEHHVLMTAFAAVLDAEQATLQYANAGQNFPYIVRCDARGAAGEVEILATSGNPLGDREIPMEIRSGRRELYPGDVFVCFTDGLVERANRAGALFGDRRLLRTMKSQPVSGEGALEALREKVVGAMESHAEGEVAGDDVTLVMCQYDPPVVQRMQSAGTG